MNRREFLEGIAAAGAAAMLPISLAADPIRGKTKDVVMIDDYWAEHPECAPCCCEPDSSTGEMIYCDRHKPPLKMFTNQYDYVIARSVEDAENILVEMMYGDKVYRKASFLYHHRNRKWISEYDEIWGWVECPPARRAAIGHGYFPIYKDEIEGDGWVEMSMDTTFPLYDEDGGVTFEATVRQFVEEFGEGYFASSEY